MSKKLVSLAVGAVIAALALTTASSSATAASNPDSPGSTSSSPASPSNPATPGGTIMVPNTNPYYTLLVEGNQPRVGYGATVNGCVIAAQRTARTPSWPARCCAVPCLTTPR